MASKSSLILCVLAIWNIDLAQGSSATHEAPTPSLDCTNLVLTMADCLSFVTNGSTRTKPEGNCCSGLKSVLKTAPSCLCEAFKSSAQFGVVLNVTKATSLPAACKISAPSATKCGSGGLSPQPSAPSPTSSGSSSSLSGPVNELSPAPTPSLGSTALEQFPISIIFLLVCLLVAIISLF
ncbi:hypothetical protein RYX36_006727 [Vicia faba]